jgi:hypothetical protein
MASNSSIAEVRADFPGFNPWIVNSILNPGSFAEVEDFRIQPVLVEAKNSLAPTGLTRIHS